MNSDYYGNFVLFEINNRFYRLTEIFVYVNFAESFPEIDYSKISIEAFVGLLSGIALIRSLS